MINFDVMQLDQTNLLFFIFSAIGLIRERRALPFFIVALGNLIHGPLGAVFLSGLIIWHRMDFNRSRWVQLKDAFAYLLILMGAVATGSFRETCVFFGVLVLSMSFGRGALGVIPPLLLLRQYIPHPEPLEVILGAAGFYWLMVEVLRWSKTSQEYIVRAILEVICGLGILFGMREYALRSFEEPAFIGLGSASLFIPLILYIFVKWKGERFWIFFHRSKKRLANSLGYRNRLVSQQNPLEKESTKELPLEIADGFDRLFLLTFLTLILLGSFYLISRGGLI